MDIIDNLEELLVIEKRIDERGNEDLRDRWESGKALIAHRVKPEGRGRPGIPKARMAELVAAIGKEQSELKYRMQFAEQNPTEDNFATVVAKFANWNAVRASLPKPKNGKSAPPKHQRRDEVIALKDQGLSQSEIREKTGLSERQLQRILEEDRVEQRIRADAAPIEWDSIPGNQQEKLERAKQSIRKTVEREINAKLLAQLDQHRAKLDEDFAKHQAAYDEQNKRINAMRDEERERYKEGIAVSRAKGLITPADYTLIRSCLHPDSRNATTDEKLAAAFRVFNDSRIKTLLVKEK